MKKGKVFGKGQIAVFVMVLALAAAVWLNVKYSGNTKFLGDVAYVSDSNKTNTAVETSAKVKDNGSDYFKTAEKEREEAYKKAEELIEETLSSAELSDEEKTAAKEGLNTLSNRIATERNIETLLKSKGFSKALAVLGDNHATIVVSGDSLTTDQTLKVQDIVTTETDISLSNIKIVTVK